MSTVVSPRQTCIPTALLTVTAAAFTLMSGRPVLAARDFEEESDVVATLSSRQKIQVNRGETLQLREIYAFEKESDSLRLTRGEYESAQEFQERKSQLLASKNKYESILFTTDVPFRLNYHGNAFRMVYGFDREAYWIVYPTTVSVHSDKSYSFSGVYHASHLDARYFQGKAEAKLRVYYKYGWNNRLFHNSTFSSLKIGGGSAHIMDGLVFTLSSPLDKARKLKEREEFLTLRLKGVRLGRKCRFFLSELSIIDTDRRATLAKFVPVASKHIQKWTEGNIWTGKKSAGWDTTQISFREFLQVWDREADTKFTKKTGPEDEDITITPEDRRRIIDACR